jgi:hypothetical protein
MEANFLKLWIIFRSRRKIFLIGENFLKFKQKMLKEFRKFYNWAKMRKNVKF